MSELCPICRQPLSQDSLAGLCPHCLSQSVFEEEKPEESSSAPPSPGTKVRYVGDYELLEELAHGGMGVVFKARQISLNRTVALKMILAGRFASATDVQRFRTEAEAAANLDHPHIVPIYEIGEHDGQLYFSMRLIEGGTLTEALARQRFTPRAAAQLMITVARAVHHAHQRGILHRDLKPGNILLDQEGRPHITDFGLAKWMHLDSSLTVSGTLIGSPSYMAPEQARGEKDISIATDVYSLGAILYELLVGKPPFHANAPVQTLRQVAEDDPVRPMLLNPQLELGLETICLKALEKDAAQRYDTANALADDLQRYLGNETLLARPPSRLYRIRMFSRRHRLKLSFSGILAITLVGGSIFSVVGFAEARRERDRARDAEQESARNEDRAVAEAARSQAVAEFIKEMLNGVKPAVALGRDTTILQDMVDDTADRLDELQEHPLVEADLRSTLALIYSALGDYSAAEDMHEAALNVLVRTYGKEHEEVADKLHDLGAVLLDSGRHFQAEERFNQALSIRRQLLGPLHTKTLATSTFLGQSLYSRGEYESGFSILTNAVQLQRQQLQNGGTGFVGAVTQLALALVTQRRPQEAEVLCQEEISLRMRWGLEADKPLADLLDVKAVALERQGKWGEAESVVREALEIATKVFGENHPHIAYLLNRLADTLRMQRKWDAALDTISRSVQMTRETHGDSHPALSVKLINLSFILEGMGEANAAEVPLREAIEIRRKTLDRDHLDTAFALLSLGDLLKNQGKLEEAESPLWEGLEIRKRIYPLHNPSVTASIQALAYLYEQQGKTAEADKLFQEAIINLRAHAGEAFEPSAALAVILHHYADVLRKRGSLRLARPMAEEAVNLYLENQEWPANEREHAFSIYAHLLRHDRDWAGAEAIHRHHFESVSARLPETDPRIADALSNLALMLHRQEKLSEAADAFGQSLSILRETGSNQPVLGSVLHHYAAVLHQQGRNTEARDLAEEAVVQYRRHPDWPSTEREHALRILNGIVEELDEGKKGEAAHQKEIK